MIGADRVLDRRDERNAAERKIEQVENFSALIDEGRA